MHARMPRSLIHANIVTTYQYELKPLGEVEHDGAGPGAGMLEITADSGKMGAAASCWKLYIVQEFCEYGALKCAIDQGWFRTAADEACLVSPRAGERRGGLSAGMAVLLA